MTTEIVWLTYRMYCIYVRCGLLPRPAVERLLEREEREPRSTGSVFCTSKQLQGSLWWIYSNGAQFEAPYATYCTCTV